MCVCVFDLSDSCLILSTPRAVAHQAPMSIGFPRQEYLSGLPFPSPGDLLDPGIESGFPALQTNALPSEPPGLEIAFFIFFSMKAQTGFQIQLPWVCQTVGNKDKLDILLSSGSLVSSLGFSSSFPLTLCCYLCKAVFHSCVFYPAAAARC